MLSATFDFEEIQSSIALLENRDCFPMTIILDNVRTPDNIGALTRIAASIGCKQIITTKVRKNTIFIKTIIIYYNYDQTRLPS